MANDNETVDQLCEEMVQETLHFRTVHVDYYGDRILAAHNREIAAKDAEIEKLKEKVAMRDCSCEDSDSERMEAEGEANRLRSLVKELVSRFDEWNTVHPQSDSVISGNLWRSLEETIIKARKECV